MIYLEKASKSPEPKPKLQSQQRIKREENNKIHNIGRKGDKNHLPGIIYLQRKSESHSPVTNSSKAMNTLNWSKKEKSHFLKNERLQDISTMDNGEGGKVFKKKKKKLKPKVLRMHMCESKLPVEEDFFKISPLLDTRAKEKILGVEFGVRNEFKMKRKKIKDGEQVDQFIDASSPSLLSPQNTDAHPLHYSLLNNSHKINSTQKPSQFYGESKHNFEEVKLYSNLRSYLDKNGRTQIVRKRRPNVERSPDFSGVLTINSQSKNGRHGKSNSVLESTRIDNAATIDHKEEEDVEENPLDTLQLNPDYSNSILSTNKVIRKASPDLEGKGDCNCIDINIKDRSNRFRMRSDVNYIQNFYRKKDNIFDKCRNSFNPGISRNKLPIENSGSGVFQKHQMSFDFGDAKSRNLMHSNHKASLSYKNRKDWPLLDSTQMIRGPSNLSFAAGLNNSNPLHASLKPKRKCSESLLIKERLNRILQHQKKEQEKTLRKQFIHKHPAIALLEKNIKLVDANSIFLDEKSFDELKTFGDRNHVAQNQRLPQIQNHTGTSPYNLENIEKGSILHKNLSSLSPFQTILTKKLNILIGNSAILPHNISNHKSFQF